MHVFRSPYRQLPHGRFTHRCGDFEIPAEPLGNLNFQKCSTDLRNELSYIHGNILGGHLLVKSPDVCMALVKSLMSIPVPLRCAQTHYFDRCGAILRLNSGAMCPVKSAPRKATQLPNATTQRIRHDHQLISLAFAVVRAADNRMGATHGL